MSGDMSEPRDGILTWSPEDSDADMDEENEHSEREQEEKTNEDSSNAIVKVKKFKIEDYAIDKRPSPLNRVVAMSSQNPLRDNEGVPFDGMDWALFAIRNPFHHGMNGVLLDKDERNWLYFQRFKASPPHGAIIVATRGGIVKGIGAGSSSSIKLRGSGQYRNVWSIQTETLLSRF